MIITTIIQFAFKNFWLLGIIVTFINAYYFRIRSRPLVRDNPHLEEGYNKVFWGTIIFSGIPWLVMGIGITIGGIPSVFHFFMPRNGNLYVIAFHLTLIIIWILGVIWIYFKDGANFWVEYMTPLQRQSFFIRSALGVKIWFALALLGGVAGMAMMWMINMPVPDF